VTTCPACKGSKQSRALVDGYRDGHRFGEVRLLPCSTCQGTGQVDDDFKARHDVGRKVRDARVAANQMQWEWAERIGLTEQAYSLCEHGTPDSDEHWSAFLTLVKLVDAGGMTE
jgi:DNA-binding XRE family transcriptional regulator